MKSHDAPAKTLGPQAARVVVELNEARRNVFSVEDVSAVTGLSEKSARNLAGKLVAKGIATRLKPGLFILVPFELGRERNYTGNPYILAREMLRGRDYYMSHASAMDLHRMVTQPQLVVYATSTHPLRSRTIQGTEFRFVRCKPEHLFGVMDHWLDKTTTVKVSDLERTIIDGLKQPEYSGGFSEVAKGYWMRRNDIDAKRLVDYAMRLDVGAVTRRLGFLLETCKVDAPSEMERLCDSLSATYQLLDPTLPAEGHFLARWRLRINVNEDEIAAARGS
ncbi:MAG: transcriptional regulator [Deltaproteobacteria bacterium]|nr:transcriptional regulator [Deltaproteobacteria bacterium]